MKRRWLISILLSSFALSFGLAGACFAMPQPTEQFFVNDYANVLSEETEKFILENSEKIDDAKDIQIVVVTVENLGGKDLESYATEMFREYKIGDDDKNYGLLLLLSLEEHAFRIEVGYGLEGTLPDGKTGRIQDTYIIPYFKEGKWDEGILNGYKAFFAEIAKEFNYDSEMDPVEGSGEMPLPMLILLSLVCIFFYYQIVSSILGSLGLIDSSGGKWHSSGGGWHSSGGGRSSSSSSGGSSGGGRHYGKGGSSGGGGSTRYF